MTTPSDFKGLRDWFRRELGILIRRRREEEQWSQQKLAEQLQQRAVGHELGHQQSIDRLENGRARIGLEHLQVLADVLPNTELSYFLQPLVGGEAERLERIQQEIMNSTELMVLRQSERLRQKYAKQLGRADLDDLIGSVVEASFFMKDDQLRYERDRWTAYAKQVGQEALAEWRGSPFMRPDEHEQRTRHPHEAQHGRKERKKQ